MRTFTSFYSWRSKIENDKVDIYFKTYLKEIGLKPRKGEIPCEYVDVYVNGTWKRGIECYNLEQTEEIKKRKINILEINEENLCKSLYVINKSAKKSRDAKKYSYDSKKYRSVTFCKKRQNNLYELKECVIKKMYDEGILKVKGYHKQFENLLLLYFYKNYSYHVPVLEIDETIEYLGEIDYLIESKSLVNDIGFFEDKLLLETYIN